ncbi:MAG: VOC family protein [Pseudomonadota bacterium]
MDVKPDNETAPDAGPRGFTVRALGEVAIRCADIAAMTAFYRDVLGLKVFSGDHRDGIVFFRLGEDYGGHVTVLALFAESAGRVAAGAGSSLHHIALTVDRSEQQAAMDWYDSLGIAYTLEEFDWVGWRGVFVKDPEGNTVELVAKVRDGLRA